MKPLSKILIFTILISFISCQNNEKYEQLKSENENIRNEMSQLKTKLQELESKVDTNVETNSDFNNEMKCQDMLNQLKSRWDNVIGIYYSKVYNTCMVKYVKDGVVKESKIENMKDSGY